MKNGYTLADLAMYNLEKMAELDKVAFEPMPGGQMQQPVDPAAQGAPVDPAAQGAPVDPSMAAGGGAPAASLPPPAAAPAAPAPAMHHRADGVRASGSMPVRPRRRSMMVSVHASAAPTRTDWAWVSVPK